MKIQEARQSLLRLTREDIDKMSTKELLSVARQSQTYARQSIAQLKKAGIKQSPAQKSLPKQFRGKERASITQKNTTRSQAIKLIERTKTFARARTSTVQGYREELTRALNQFSKVNPEITKTWTKQDLSKLSAKEIKKLTGGMNVAFDERGTVILVSPGESGVKQSEVGKYWDLFRKFVDETDDIDQGEKYRIWFEVWNDRKDLRDAKREHNPNARLTNKNLLEEAKRRYIEYVDDKLGVEEEEAKLYNPLNIDKKSPKLYQ